MTKRTIQYFVRKYGVYDALTMCYTWRGKVYKASYIRKYSQSAYVLKNYLRTTNAFKYRHIAPISASIFGSFIAKEIGEPYTPQIDPSLDDVKKAVDKHIGRGLNAFDFGKAVDKELTRRLIIDDIDMDTLNKMGDEVNDRMRKCIDKFDKSVMAHISKHNDSLIQSDEITTGIDVPGATLFYRPVRGGLAAAMEEQKIILSYRGLRMLIHHNNLPICYPIEAMHIEWKQMGPDKRIEWDDVYMLLVSYPGSDLVPCGYISGNPEGLSGYKS